MDRRSVTGLELSLFGVVVLVLLAAALIGEGNEDKRKRSPDASRRSPGPDRIEVATIARRVERLRGLRFRKPPKTTFASPKRAKSLFGSATASRYSARAQLIDEEALKLLGLLEPSADLRAAVRAIADEQVIGFYDNESKRLVVRARPSEGRALEEIVLAHELVHALEDDHFDVTSRGGLSDDQALAEAALVEGTATVLMTDYAARYFGLRDLLAVVESVSGTKTELPLFVERSLLFPYEQGAEFVTTFRQRGSWRAVDQVLRLRHPRSSEQILHPEKYAVDEKPARVRLTDVTRRLAKDWRRLDRSSVGEFDLRLLFRQVGELKRAAVAAEGWGGGRFELFRRGGLTNRGCTIPCTSRDAGVLRLSWDTVADRGQAEAALVRVFEHGLKGKRLRRRGGVALWSSRGGAIGLIGRGRQNTVVFAPTAAFVAELLGSAERARG